MRKITQKIERMVFMMAMLWAQEIINGRKTYEQVPRLLKKEVRRILIDSGLEVPDKVQERMDAAEAASRPYGEE